MWPSVAEMAAFPLFCFGNRRTALSQCRAGHCVTRWTRGSVGPQAAPGTARAPLLARARGALPRMSAMAIMVTFQEAAHKSYYY